jgi:uncharacterized protein (DUF433 family)
VQSRIVSDPDILGGKPCIRGTRISVEFLLELIASGATIDDVVDSYPHLTREDVSSAVQFAANYLRGDSRMELEISH